jgi:hypothetical protein
MESMQCSQVFRKRAGTIGWASVLFGNHPERMRSSVDFRKRFPKRISTEAQRHTRASTIDLFCQCIGKEADTMCDLQPFSVRIRRSVKCRSVEDKYHIPQE